MPKPAPNPLHEQLGGAHDDARTKFDELKDVDAQLKRGRTILDDLIAKGDTVSVDDVVKAAGKMVGAGFEPKGMAGLLATLPPEAPAGTQGPANLALQAWVQQRADALTALEAKAAQSLNAAAHEMGVHALRAIAGHSIMEPPPMPPQLTAMPPMGAQPEQQTATVTAPPGNPLGAEMPAGRDVDGG